MTPFIILKKKLNSHTTDQRAKINKMARKNEKFEIMK